MQVRALERYIPLTIVFICDNNVFQYFLHLHASFNSLDIYFPNCCLNKKNLIK